MNERGSVSLEAALALPVAVLPLVGAWVASPPVAHACANEPLDPDRLGGGAGLGGGMGPGGGRVYRSPAGGPGGDATADRLSLFRDIDDTHSASTRNAVDAMPCEFVAYGEGHLRFSYANSRENLAAALERVGDSLAKLERTGELVGSAG